MFLKTLQLRTWSRWLIFAFALILALTPVATIQADDDDGESKVYGVVQSMPSGGLVGDWVIGGQQVRTTASTRFKQEHGSFRVGGYVEAEGYWQGGVLIATELETKNGNDDDNDGESKLYGVVESMPSGGLVGNWVIGGQQVRTTASTRFKQEHGSFRVGGYVEAEGYWQGGVFIATELETKGGSGDDSSGESKVYGVVESMPSGGLVGDWVISGQQVRTTASTRFEQEHGSFYVGGYVEAEGYWQGGVLIATKLEAKNSGGGDDSGQKWEIYGNVDAMPAGGFIGAWVINGQSVQATASTYFEQQHGPLQVGAYVHAEGYYDASGNRIATKIETENATPTPTPVTPTPVTPTPTPVTPTPTPTTPTPTPPPSAGSGLMHLSPEPASGSMSGGDISVDLMIQDVTDMASFEVSLAFDATIVQVNSVTLGDFLSSSGRTASLLGPNIDNGAGRVSFGAFTFGSAPGANGSGVLATITFTPVATGASPITFENALATNTQGVAINLSVRNTTISISAALAGDLNNDCMVNVTDIMVVAGLWGAQIGDPNYDSAADMDSNGRIDVVDIMAVAGNWGATCQSPNSAAVEDDASGEDRAGLFGKTPVVNRIWLGEAQRQDDGDMLVPVMASGRDIAAFQFDLVDGDGEAVVIEDVQLGEFLQVDAVCSTLQEGNSVGAYCFGGSTASGSGILAWLQVPATDDLSLVQPILTNASGQALSLTP
ncbi:MAG: hypothetical protein GXP42_18545 [Chloroflexi bacterium]|nr:hypothetical protein [Chloroflexota bacterium]